MTERQTHLTLSSTQAEAVLARWLGDAGDGVHCTGVERMHGGMINSVLRLDFDRPPHSAVIKLSGRGKSFAGEARALRYLHAHTRFPCPQVYLEDAGANVIPYAFLLLERLPGKSLAEVRLSPEDQRRVERELARTLVELHGHTRETFGAIDADPGEADWRDVFLPRVHRVRAQPEVAQRLTASVLRTVDDALAAAPQALRDQGPPTLIHGDIWAANVIVRRAEDGWHLSGLVDPGLQYADPEMELAYLEVFSTAGPAFFQAYRPHHPQRPGYEVRRRFYWLNTYLIHVWLFGDRHYREMTARVAQAIVGESAMKQ
jgi:fructosamine-3-kinase